MPPPKSHKIAAAISVLMFLKGNSHWDTGSVNWWWRSVAMSDWQAVTAISRLTVRKDHAGVGCRKLLNQSFEGSHKEAPWTASVCLLQALDLFQKFGTQVSLGTEVVRLHKPRSCRVKPGIDCSAHSEWGLASRWVSWGLAVLVEAVSLLPG